MWRAILDCVFPAQCAACNGLGSGLCDLCVPPAAPIQVQIGDMNVVALGWYEGALRSAVLALKDGRRDVAEALGERIASLIAVDAHLAYVPTTDKRRRVRGMDGVAVVAENAACKAAAYVVPALSLYARDAQRGRSRVQRLAAHSRFTVEPSVILSVPLLLVDDVCTTGATLADCARAIHEAGGRVEGAVVAAVTKPNRRDPSQHRIL